MTYSIDRILLDSIAKLTKAPFALKARYESELLLSFVLNKPRVFLHAHSEQIIESSLAEQFFLLINERVEGKPIEYITQSANFYGRAFYVNPSVLIPRPETEILIDTASHIIKKHNIKYIAEIGIGSGIITATLALLHPQCVFFATDISSAALEVAHKNIATHAPNAQIELQCGSLLADSIKKCELIVSNPPYISTDYPISLPLSFEPKIALFAGSEGLDVLQDVIIESKARRARLICEIGYEQKDKLLPLLKDAKEVQFYKDLSGFDRGFSANFGD
ncbi:peptide chain release factor N(5)-glutamine methyltransferase [Helicobacter jaachi]|uniref:peptide chain release factor N(5)-glutamine methyltransferase n=1 Tax=Helicobacter jaachi TaxID=1677920 RepID=A0A4U8TBZ5_9HELI|nr:peptide chain release factor N(5)-glutamine methyltransferase [Helicobacter jaachi]TLD97470.1 peptide chain release factor N(5)-glutamine methyltransferase [Helicobacter jaachi]